MVWELVVRGPEGPLAKAVVGAGARLGRAPNMDLVLNHGSVSRVHARVEERDGRLWMVDAGSRNGLMLAGRRVEAVRFEDGQEFGIGELLVRVQRVAAVRSADGPLEFAEDVKSLLERTTYRQAAGPLLEDAALEDPAAIELSGPTTPKPAPPAAAAGPSVLDRRAALVQPKRSAGIFSGDLAQQPLWVRALAFVLVPAVLVGAVIGAFQLAAFLRGG